MMEEIEEIVVKEEAMVLPQGFQMSTRGMVKLFPACVSCKKKWAHPEPYCSSCETTYHMACLPKDGNCICKRPIAPEEQLQVAMNTAISEARHQLRSRVLKLVPPKRATNAAVGAQNAQLAHHLEDKDITLVNPPSIPIRYKFEENLSWFNVEEYYLDYGRRYVFPCTFKEIPLKGTGVVATRLIKQKELVASYCGNLLPYYQLVSLCPANEYIMTFHKGFDPSEDLSVVPLSCTNYGVYLNHSHEGNAKPLKVWSSKGPLILLVSTRIIRRGQEILWNYGEDYPTAHFV